MLFKSRYGAYLVLTTMIAATALCFMSSLLQAQTTYVWNTAASGDWDTAGQWTPSGPADGAGNTADLSTQNINGFVDLGMGMNRTIGHIAFGDTDPNGTPAVWTVYDSAIDPNNPRTITLDGNGSTPSITVNRLGEVSPGVNDVLIQDVNLAGSQGFNKEGTGILTLTGPATSITGAVNVNGGTLRLDSLTVPVTGAVFGYAGGAQTISSFNLADGTTLEYLSLNDASIDNISVAAGAAATIQTGTNNLNMGNVTGAGIGQGSTVNVNLFDDGNTYSLEGTWSGLDTVNFVGQDAAGNSFVRMRANSGNPAFNLGSFVDTAVNLDNANLVVRSYSHGGDVLLGSLSGTATATLSGGNSTGAGGSAPTYIIGSLDTNTEFAGTVFGGGGGGNDEGMTLIKVGTGTLTLSGTFTGTFISGSQANISWQGGVVKAKEGTLALTNTLTSIPGGYDSYSTVIDVAAGATLDVSGTSTTFSTSALQDVRGGGTIEGPYNHDEGRLRPGDVAVNDADTDLTALSTPAAGTLTFNGSLSFNGGDIAYDMDTTPAGTNDLVSVTGTASVAGGGTVSPNFLNGAPAVGLTYTVLTASSGISDSPAGWTVNWFGRGTAPTVFKSGDGNSLQFTTTDVAAVGIVTWTGVNSGDWDVQSATTNNWLLSGSPDDFFQGDHVTFPESGVTNYAVNITQNVSPSSMLVDSTTDYSFASTGGVIQGSGTFIKRGTSTLTMQFNNGFSGAATIERGTADVGAFGGALGTGSLTLGDGTPGGGGTLFTTANSVTNSSLVIANGDNTIRSDNGTVFFVPALSGSGNLTFASNDDRLRVDLGTVDPAFSGNVTFGVHPDPDPNSPQTMWVRINGAGNDFPMAAVTLVGGAELVNRAGSGTVVTIELGALTGDNTTLLTPLGGGSSSPGTNWVIGALNAPTEFAGVIQDGGEGFPDPNSLAQGHVTKVGTAELILSGANTYTGDTTVMDGTLSITSPYLADGADVYLTTGSIFDLDFGSLATIDTVDELFIDGVPQDTGTWGRSGSGADHESDLFDGDGLLMVSTFSGIPGDFDMDNDVDGDDFLLWQRNPGIGLLSDWEANYGFQGLQAAQSAASSAVPEPTSGLLAALGLALAWSAGRRRRSA